MGQVSISLEEYEKLQNNIEEAEKIIAEKDEIIIKLKDNSLAAITRYDRVIPDYFIANMTEELGKQVIEGLKEQISIHDDVNKRAQYYTYQDMNITIDTFPKQSKVIKDTIKNITCDFIKRNCNTISKSNISMSTVFINADEVMSKAAIVYDEQFKKEYGERIKKLEDDEAKAQALIEHNRQQKEEYKQKIANAESLVKNELEDKKKQINILSEDLNAKDDEIAGYLKEIDNLKSDKVYLENENNGYKETIANQVVKLTKFNNIKKKWWFKLFYTGNSEDILIDLDDIKPKCDGFND